MRLGSKKIFHLEAFVAKLMTIIKQFNLYVPLNSMLTERMGFTDDFE